MAKGKGELAVKVSPARLLGVLAHILTHQLHCAVGGHSCISHVAEAQDCNATPPPSTSTSSPDSSSRCLCQTVAARLHLTLTSNLVKVHSASQGCLMVGSTWWLATRTTHSLAGSGITSLAVKPVAMPTSLLKQWCSVCQKTEGCNVD